MDRWFQSRRDKMGPKTKSIGHFRFSHLLFLVTLTAICSSSDIAQTGKFPWVKYCRGQQKKFIHTQECTKGIEFYKEVQLDCFCVKGVWAIFSDSCDTGHSFVILNGRGNCFQLEIKATRFINFGSQEPNSIPSVYFIGKTKSDSRSTFITETNERSKIEEFIQYAFAEKMPQSSSSDFFHTLVCEKRLAKHKESQPDSLLIYSLSNATMVMSRFHNLVCDPRFRELQPAELTVGNLFRGGEKDSAPAPPCSLTCQSATRHTGRHSIGKRSIDKHAQKIVISKTAEELRKEGILNFKQNEATSVILRQNNAFLLFGVKENLNVSQNWIVIQKANKILKTACPDLDPTIQNSMVRMFRFLHAYFKDGRHVSKEYLQSDLRLTRIKDSLERCSADAKKISFKYGPPGTCEKDKKIVEATIIGKTLLAVGDDMQLLPKEAYSRELHDVLIESIWKMISFVHYFCSEYFAEMPFDYGALTQMFTGFLGEDLVYRWYNPEVANKGLYSAFNAKNMLDHYVQGLDVCVAIAKKIASFPTWIDRPNLIVDVSQIRKKRVKRNAFPPLHRNKCLRTSDIMIEGGMEVCTSKTN